MTKKGELDEGSYNEKRLLNSPEARVREPVAQKTEKKE